MKKMNGKQGLAILLSLIMILSLAVSAFADGAISPSAEPQQAEEPVPGAQVPEEEGLREPAEEEAGEPAQGERAEEAGEPAPEEESQGSLRPVTDEQEPGGQEETGGISRADGAQPAGNPVSDYVEYYVSASGDDETGDGSEIAPFASLARAAEAANAAPTADVVICILSDLVMERSARFQGKNVELLGVGDAWILSRGEEFATAEDALRGQYHPALIELGVPGLTGIPAGSLIIENLILDDAGRHQGLEYARQSGLPVLPAKTEEAGEPAEPVQPEQTEEAGEPAEQAAQPEQKGEAGEPEQTGEETLAPADPAALEALSSAVTDAVTAADAEPAEAPAPAEGEAPALPAESDNLNKVQDAIIAGYENARLILSSGTELRNFGGLSAVHLTGTSSLSMEEGSAVFDSEGLEVPANLSAVFTEDRSVAQAVDPGQILERTDAIPSQISLPGSGAIDGSGISIGTDSEGMTSVQFSSTPRELTQALDNLGVFEYTVHYNLVLTLSEKLKTLAEDAAKLGLSPDVDGTITVNLDSRLTADLSQAKLESTIFELDGDPVFDESAHTVTAKFKMKSGWQSNIEHMTDSINFQFDSKLPALSFVPSTAQQDSYLTSSASTLIRFTGSSGTKEYNSGSMTAKTKMLGVPSALVSYDENGGDFGTGPGLDLPVSEQKEYTLATSPIPTHAPEDGVDVVFVGWSESRDTHIYAHKETKPSTVTKVAIQPLSNKTVYAVWGYDTNGDGIADVDQRLVTLSFDANGGTGAPAPIVAAAVAEAGVSIDIPEQEPTRTYYTFDGWSKEADATAGEYKYDAERKAKRDLLVVKDTTLYAIWVENYKLFYDANGGTNAPAAQTLPVQTPTGTNAAGKTIYTGELYITDQQPVRQGYVFQGWAVSRRGAAEYYAGDRAEISGGNVTLYAVWLRDGSSYGTTNYGSTAPRTGDESNPLLYAVIALAALLAVGVVGFFLLRKKKDTEPEDQNEDPKT